MCRNFWNDPPDPYAVMYDCGQMPSGGKRAHSGCTVVAHSPVMWWLTTRSPSAYWKSPWDTEFRIWDGAKGWVEMCYTIPKQWGDSRNMRFELYDYDKYKSWPGYAGYTSLVVRAPDIENGDSYAGRKCLGSVGKCLGSV